MTKNILKTWFSMIIIMFIVVNTSIDSFAISKSDIKLKTSLVELANKLLEASNNHNLEEVASFYSNTYLSGDNLNKQQVLDLIKETWATYPDIRYTSDIKDIRYSDNWAAIETQDSSTGTTSKVSEITSDKGDLSSESHSIIYLRKFGKDWKIVGDQIFYESAIVKFGSAKDLEVRFCAPEQVQAGEMYSGKISMEVPVGTFAVGSITKEPIIYPRIKPKEKFRTINQSIGSLERVFESNLTNNNELVTATVGITELTEDNQARPTVKLKGICIIGNRVNVLPGSIFDKDEFIITNKENLDVYNEEEPAAKKTPAIKN